MVRWRDESGKRKLIIAFFCRLVTMTYQLKHPFKKDKYHRWEPKFSIADSKKDVFSRMLEKELCDYTMFERKTPEGMYAELLRAMEKVGLSVAKKQPGRFGSMSHR